MSAPFVFRRNGRSLRAGLVLAAIYALLIAGTELIDATLWITVPIALLTVPAVVDMVRNPSAGLELDADRLHWHTGARQAEVRLDEIAHVRMDTRWDLSVRVTLYLQGGKTVRLPHESLPHHRALERALHQHGIPVERHHFTVF